MRRLLWCAVTVGGMLAAGGSAFAQHSPSAGGWIGGGTYGRGSGGASAGSIGSVPSTPSVPSGAPTATSAQPAGGGFFRMHGSAPVGTVTDPGFAGRLGTNVGIRVLPPVAMPPGIGNINSPGMQPLPAGPQPLPTGSPFPTPNINHPGGTPGMKDVWQHGSGEGHHRGRFRGRPGFGGPYGGPIFYTFPYYIPVYTEVITTTPAAPAQPPYLGPYTTPPPPAQPQPQQPSAAPARTVTLLAFKDHTVLAVTDYWLDGDTLVYETSSGMRTIVPLDRLDFALTQQLNRERNVRFVLEARP